ncbi:MAG TPA: manganese catalase family protein [Tepidisphaeraceae bacterium]|nr:manganese catalase family protein [Tepidisphaeraceae bacterium]
MILRIDRLPIELPAPKKQDPASAASVQELLGGRFGEMSTLMNYTYQSMNFRGRTGVRPYYSLIANIAAEEYGHIEVVAATINSLLNGPPAGGAPPAPADPLAAPLADGQDGTGLRHHFIGTGMGAFCGDSGGLPWNGTYVFSSGNLILDLLHNFFLENGARTNKLRVYEMTKDPCARQMLGYLFVRGGVHALAYAKALEQLTGVKMSDMLPIPKIENKMFPEAQPFITEGSHRRLYRFSPDDYKEAGFVWQGTHPDDGLPLEFVDGPPEGGKMADLDGISEAFAPEYSAGEIFEMAQKLYQKAKS